MNHTGKFYETTKQKLMNWMWDNPKLLHKICRHDLQHLFEFHPQRGLSIDLRCFEPEYYYETFFPPERKQANIDEFVNKLCLVLKQSLIKTNRAYLSVTITVRHMVSQTSHWKTFFIDQNYTGKKTARLSPKEQDWYHSLRS